MLIRVAHDGGLLGAMQAFHEAVSCGVVGGSPAEVDAAHLSQALEEVRLKLSSLVRGDGLWTAKTCYPAREQGT